MKQNVATQQQILSVSFLLVVHMGAYIDSFSNQRFASRILIYLLQKKGKWRGNSAHNIIHSFFTSSPSSLFLATLIHSLSFHTLTSLSLCLSLSLSLSLTHTHHTHTLTHALGNPFSVSYFFSLSTLCLSLDILSFFSVSLFLFLLSVLASLQNLESKSLLLEWQFYKFCMS